jgi:transposase InsO family protein
MPASTFHRILQRYGVSRLSDLERRTGRAVRRIETVRPGELVHVDVKKQARIPSGGGWRVNGQHRRLRNGRGSRPSVGYAYIHSAVDAHSRLAYSEIHDDEQAVTALGFWRRALAFFSSYGIAVERVMTDHGACYRSNAFGAELVEGAITHTRIRPYRPQTNGKVERYNRTLLNEWAYARPYRSEAARTRSLAGWLAGRAGWNGLSRHGEPAAKERLICRWEHALVMLREPVRRLGSPRRLGPHGLWSHHVDGDHDGSHRQVRLQCD